MSSIAIKDDPTLTHTGVMVIADRYFAAVALGPGTLAKQTRTAT